MECAAEQYHRRQQFRTGCSCGIRQHCRCFQQRTGYAALTANTTGNFNSAVDQRALAGNTSGSNQTAIGDGALLSSTSGSNNSAVGFHALPGVTTGANNIELGNGAGQSLITGSNDIDVGNNGVAAESNIIRIGTQGTQSKTFIAGISGASVSGSAVLVSSTGQLGIVVSSARYKRDIHDMDAASSNLMKLRPVTFEYKQDPQGERQYGLIAEEVARLYPELVSYDTDGKVITVRYHELVPMLLNEAQKQAEQIKHLRAEVAADKAAREAERASFEQRPSALEQNLAAVGQNQTLAAALGR
jgi:trimeric autotransporter adhesin